MNALNKAILQPFKFLCSNVDLQMVPGICCNSDAVSDLTKKNRFNAVVTPANRLILLKDIFIRPNNSLSLGPLFNVLDLDQKGRLGFSATHYFKIPIYWNNAATGYPRWRYAGDMLASVGPAGSFYFRGTEMFDYSTNSVSVGLNYTPPNATSVAVVQTAGLEIDMNDYFYWNTFENT